MQTVATQSNLTIKSFKPAPIVTKQLHAEWPIALELDGTYHNLAHVLRPRRQVHAHRQREQRSTIKAKDKPEPNSTITAECVATTFVLLDKPRRSGCRRGRQGAMRRPRHTRWRTVMGRSSRRVMMSVLVLAVWLVPAQPAQAPRAATPARSRRRRRGGSGAAQPAAAAPTQPEAYSYNPEGRRDPFVSLISRGFEPAAAGKRGEGLAGLTTAEITVRGVVQSGGSYVAMVQGPDMKTYIVHGTTACSTARSRASARRGWSSSRKSTIRCRSSSSARCARDCERRTRANDGEAHTA